MKCTYHLRLRPRSLQRLKQDPVLGCAHQIKGQSSTVRLPGAGSGVGDCRQGPADPHRLPRRAAVCSLNSGMGAVTTTEYMKALTYFAVFAALRSQWRIGSRRLGFAAFRLCYFHDVRLVIGPPGEDPRRP